MYNFLDPKLMPKVSTKCATMENYEAENLISPNLAIRARGFLAYTVIKPPVEIEFEFICPVDISYIDLNSTVGLQRCSGIEIFAKNSYNPYISIGRAFYETNSVVFCDSRKFSRQRPPPLFDDNNSLHFFKSDKVRLFTNASGIKVLIFRTFRSVPCLSSVKVFGTPSRACSQTTVNTIMRLAGPSQSQNENCITTNTKSVDNGGLEIPQDFIDSLTCEIMTIPMTLPSGKTIDRDTLEKHSESEKSFGRKPGDPFTGLKFTDTRKPVFNSALKSRIDMFLLHNSANPGFYGLKRTLGQSNCIESPTKRRKIFRNGKCGVCAESEALYIIPCKHLYCRPCLLNLNNFCSVCDKEFAKSEAERCYC